MNPLVWAELFLAVILAALAGAVLRLAILGRPYADWVEDERRKRGVKGKKSLKRNRE